MSKGAGLIVTVAVVLFGGIAMLGGEAYAQRKVIFEPVSPEAVCYRVSTAEGNFSKERYVLDIKPDSTLSGAFFFGTRGHPAEFRITQSAFSVFGKHVGTCSGDTVRPVVGTLISTLPVGQPLGARLGLQSFNTTFDERLRGGSCGDVEISCKAADTAGFPPPRWHCSGLNKCGLMPANAFPPLNTFVLDLDLVDQTTDLRCGLFEDGQPVTIENVNSTGLCPAFVVP